MKSLHSVSILLHTCIGALLALPTLLALTGAEPDQETPAQLLERVTRSIVVINQEDRNGEWNGLGTGFVISRDGLVATSFHVIGEGRMFTLNFADGTSYRPVEIKAWDRARDLAIIRIEGTGFTPMRLGDSDNLKQGRKVYALGNPQGLKFSAVEGIVSAIREFEAGAMVQVAIPVEPGNSGGPLFDDKGRVQGLVSMKSLLSDNLGFATPVNYLKELMEKPNPVPIDKWLALGSLPEAEWRNLFGAHWRKRGPLITVQGSGQGFGGRALIVSKQTLPPPPYELSVKVRLDDEGGAAGLAFAVGEDDRHYGFYPTGGKLRLTHFDGPSVYSWNILRDTSSSAYLPGQWNDLKIRVNHQKLLCFVNGEQIFAQELEHPLHGSVGLAKFRQTRAEFKNFRVQKFNSDLPPDNLRDKLLAQARDLEKKAQSLRHQAQSAHETSRIEQILQALDQDQEKPRTGNLFRAALLVASLDNPDLEIEPYELELDSLARAVRERFAGLSETRSRVEILNQVMFEENGFHGSRADYYNYQNSYLNAVLDDREGIPLTLAMIYLEVAWKAGLHQLFGLGFPGHFMVGFETPEPVYIDVFDRGTLYGEDKIYSVVNARSEIPLARNHFRPVTGREMILRMLQNLIAVASERKDPTRTLQYLNVLLAIEPDDVPQRFRRAFVLMELDRKDQARSDLEILIKAAPPELDIDRVQSLLDRLR